MARKSKRPEKKSIKIKVKAETKHSILMVVFFAVALFSILAAFGIAGVAGDFFYKAFNYLLGFGYFLLPLILIILGISFTKKSTRVGDYDEEDEEEEEHFHFTLSKQIGAILFVLSGLGLIDAASLNHGGGVLGQIFAYPFLRLFDSYIGILFLGAILIISIILVFDRKPKLVPLWQKIGSLFGSIFSKRKTDPEEYDYESEEYEPEDEEHDDEEEEDEEVASSATHRGGGNENTEELPRESTFSPSKSRLPQTEYKVPPLKLLEKDRGKPNVGDIKANANTVKRTLQNFGIDVEMDEITIGPTFTRYALKPAEGVRLSRITALNNDMSLALAAHPIRIEAPIPGKSLVGIEIPNKVKSTVGLASLLGDRAFKDSDKPLLIALGRRLSGKPLFANLARMPHALVGGTTGSGKSVLIHSLITSLLYRNGPENLRFIMVDPKRVELTLYNKIPHLLTPVITDAKRAILALRWAAQEMERRYDILEKEQVRDIASYHNKIAKQKSDEDIDLMPYIVVVVDELADIMTTYPRELESAIVRLAQMSRAVGIHLILSTQRPSVNVITGLIKANIPGRIALQVSSQVDSRTILDMSGAEKLVGAGDMLYMSGQMSKPERIQSAFISEEEVKRVVKYLTKQYQDILWEDEISLKDAGGKQLTIGGTQSKGGLDDDEEDELYEEAREIIIAAGKASTSYLQRKLKIGYARAARLVDMLEERGIVGPAEGSKPREVLVQADDDYESDYESDIGDENEEYEEEE